MKKYKRSGDHYFHTIEKMPEVSEVKHNGKFVFGVGEASNHRHVITVEKPQDLIIGTDSKGNYYFQLKSVGKLLHTIGDSFKVADHKPIIIQPGIYKQVHEREVDIFSQVVRRVID